VGRTARLGVMCLMALALGLARLVEVELDPADAPPLSLQAAATEAAPAIEESPNGAPAAAVAAPAPPASPPRETEWPAGRVYVVRPGETLGTIAKKVYGSSRFWKKLQDANRDVIPDPERMRAGARLQLPE
jgi:nucleoid-associated protein YgaU